MEILEYTLSMADYLNELLCFFLGQMSRMFGMEDEFGEDALLGRLEGLKDVIEQVNRQFKDPVPFGSFALFFFHYCSVPTIPVTFLNFPYMCRFSL